MRKFILDFIFDEKTGESNIVIDFNDDSLSAMEINDSIQSGELREKAVELAGKLYGNGVADGIKDGRIKILCLDHHPELQKGGPGIAISPETKQKKDLKH